MPNVFEEVAGPFSVLVARLDRRAALAGWGRSEPALAGAQRAGQLAELTAPGSDRVRARAIIAALVRIAAVDGGDDPDAALMVVHLLRPAVLRRAATAGRDFRAAVQLLVGELTIGVRAFPWRRCTPTPGRLLLDAWHNLWRGDLAVADGGRPAGSRPIDPAVLAGWAEGRQAHYVTVTKPDEPGADAELVDVLVWAARVGVLAAADARLLWDLGRAGGYGAGAAGAVAEARGVAASTVRRRRNAAVAALRDARERYLAAV